jgi:predicted DNA-binding antitoxin AbrB/MazE fold protein
MGARNLKEGTTVKIIIIQRRIATEMCRVISKFTATPETST